MSPPFLIGTQSCITAPAKGTLNILYNARSTQYRTGAGEYTVHVHNVLTNMKGIVESVSHNVLTMPEDIAFRHGGKAVASYCDGHVAAIAALPRYWVVNVADEAEFDHDVLHCPAPLYVEFYAPWSPWCRHLDWMIDDIANRYRGRIQMVKVNSDNFPQLIARYHITGYPTLSFYNNGSALGTLTGYDPNSEQTITDKIKALWGMDPPAPPPPPQTGSAAQPAPAQPGAAARPASQMPPDSTNF